MPAMPLKLTAMAASLHTDTWQVVFMYRDENGRALWDMPSWNIPCQDLQHAFAVADAFNRKDR